jgi:hypothetical protein
MIIEGVGFISRLTPLDLLGIDVGENKQEMLLWLSQLMPPIPLRRGATIAPRGRTLRGPVVPLVRSLHDK